MVEARYEKLIDGYHIYMFKEIQDEEENVKKIVASEANTIKECLQPLESFFSRLFRYFRFCFSLLKFYLNQNKNKIKKLKR